MERVTDSPEQVRKLEEAGFKKLESTQEPGEEAGSGKPMEQMTMGELRDLAKQKSLEGYSSLNKEELLAALKDVD